MKNNKQPKDISIFPYSLFYVYFDQYFYIRGITLQSYVLALMVVFTLVSVLFNFFVGFMLFFIVFLLTSNFWSLLYLTNFLFDDKIQINGLLIVNFIIGIGFSVEFCVHTILRYNKSKGNYSNKIIKAISDIVSVVFKGIFLTKILGLSVLFFSPIPLFVVYYARVYYILILLCGFYGLVVTPVFLDTFGPCFLAIKEYKKRSFNEYLLSAPYEAEAEDLMSSQNNE